MRTRLILASVLIALPAAAADFVLTHTGYLLDSADAPITNPAVSLKFRIFDKALPQDQTLVWSGACTLPVRKGAYVANLGDGTCGPPLTTELMPLTAARYLEIEVADEVLSPRLRIATVPTAGRAAFADNATNATTLGGEGITSFLRKSETTLPLTPGGTPGNRSFLRGDGQWGTPEAAGEALGDLGGGYPGPMVIGLQGRPLVSTPPIAGQLLGWDGSRWAPVPAGAGGSAAGDLGGTYPAPTVTAIQGRGVSATPPTDGQLLAWNGTAWTPTAPTPVGAAGTASGDLSGTYPAPAVAKLQGRAVSAATPTVGQALTWDGTKWVPGGTLQVSPTSFANLAAAPAASTMPGGMIYVVSPGAFYGSNGNQWLLMSAAPVLTKKTFAYTGNEQQFTVPAGVTSMTVKLWGAAGGNEGATGSPNRGGGGGFTKGRLTVTPGDVMKIIVGQGGVAGQFSGTTYGGGGAGTAPAETGMGGGRTAIRIGSGTSDVATAGGGGGAGDYWGGGGGGGLAGVPGGNGLVAQGKGGTQSGGGAPNGAAYAGGAALGARSGGGGGGYFGGGGGTIVGDGFDRGGGGGGSGYIGGLTEATMTAGTTGGAGVSNDATGGFSGGASDPDYPGGNVGNSGPNTNDSGGHGYVVLLY